MQVSFQGVYRKKSAMKAISASMTDGLQVGSKLKCADNSGAKILEVISVRGFRGRRRTRPSGGVADQVTCKVKSGVEAVRHEVLQTVVIRQRKEYKRLDGMRISFEDNAGVVVTEKFEPKGTIIKGPIAKEVIERFPILGKVASIVV